MNYFLKVDFDITNFIYFQNSTADNTVHVDSEIFAKILFSLIALKDTLVLLKIRD